MKADRFGVVESRAMLGRYRARTEQLGGKENDPCAYHHQRKGHGENNGERTCCPGLDNSKKLVRVEGIFIAAPLLGEPL
jgi:hypothetical protein